MLLTCGSFLLIQPSAQLCHSLSRHIGVPFGSTMHIQPLVPALSCFILPSAPTSMIVAFFEIDGGAALMARAIFVASEPPLLLAISCPDLALGSSAAVFALSWAVTVEAATMRSPVTIAMLLRMMYLRGWLDVLDDARP